MRGLPGGQRNDMLQLRIKTQAKDVVVLTWLLLAACFANPAAAFAPKSMGVVTLDVKSVVGNGEQEQRFTEGSLLELSVNVHSQVAIANLRLDLSAYPQLTLRDGLQSWRGAINAGETLQIRYVFRTTTDIAKNPGVLCQFDLFRDDDGLSQWLSAAQYQYAASIANVPGQRVLVQDNADANATLQSIGDSVNQPSYLIEYSLD